MGIGRKSGRNKARNTFDGMRCGEGPVGTNDVTGPAIQDTSWEKSKSGYGSGWQKPKWTTREERAQRRAERKAERAEKQRNARTGGLSKILEDKKKNMLKDPHADDDKGKVKLNMDGAIGYLKDMLMSGGSVISSNGGICLDGEENGAPSAAEGETLVYSMKDGKRKWRELPSVDSSGSVAASGMFAWDERSRTMGPGGVMVGSTWVEASGTGKKEDGTYWVKVVISGAAVSAVVVDNQSSTGDFVRHIPIYTISNGKVVRDLRNVFFVQCWE